MNKRIFQLTFFLLLTAILSSCGDNVVIDNQGDSPVAVEIGRTRHELGPHSSISVKLKPEQFHVKITAGDSILKEGDIVVEKGGIVNASSEPLILWKELYGLQKDRSSLLDEQDVELDSITYRGDFTVLTPSQVYVEKDWDKDLDQAFPESKPLMVFSDFIIISKVFRKEDFVTTYNSRVMIQE